MSDTELSPEELRSYSKDDRLEDATEDSLDIKPPQKQAARKQERHRHRHKEAKHDKRHRADEYDSYDRRRDRDRDKHRERSKDKSRTREDHYEARKQEREAEERRREKSKKERERLERIEVERRRLDKEREMRERELKELREQQAMTQRQERDRAERSRRRREEKHRSRAERRLERHQRRERHHSSRSPLTRETHHHTHHDDEEYEEEAYEQFEQDFEDEDGHEEGEHVEEEEEGQEVISQRSDLEEGEHSEEGQSDSDSSDSGSDSGSSSSSDEQTGHAKSKFDDVTDNESDRAEEEPEEEVEEVDLEEEEDEAVEEEKEVYDEETPPQSPLELKLPPYYPALQGCRSVEEFHCLNRIEEGTFGVVYRARDKKLDEIVALKRLKMEKEKEGFPITSLREINTLLKAQHTNIVTVREIVVGSNMDKIYIVMDYVEHDLKSLMETMKEPFMIGEVKTLMVQLLRGVAHLHDNWIIHRDLKTSNLLLSHGGILKIADFGLAREYGSPLKQYTQIVVTLWYRAPELLMGSKIYSTPIDVWSVGCIFAEMLTRKPLFPGKSEIDELNRIFKELGTPNEKIWSGVSELPAMKKCQFTEYPYNQLRKRFGSSISDVGFDLLNRFLTYNPSRRISAEEGLKHAYFQEVPLPVSPHMFPTWPAKSELSRSQRAHGNSPKPPSGGKAFSKLMGDDDEGGFLLGNKNAPTGAGFALKF